MNAILLGLLFAISSEPVENFTPDPVALEDRVSLEGSSTIAPYAEALAALLPHEGMMSVVRNGSATGLASLCSGNAHSPDIATSSRPIKTAELKRCADAGIEALIELPIGRDGIVFAQSKKSSKLELSAKDIYLATSYYTPRDKDDCVLIKNTRTKWKEIRSDLPDREITFIGPPRNSGTRDVFISMAIENGARTFTCLAEIEKTNPEYFQKATRIRRDSHWIDGGEQDEAVARTLTYVQEAVGIFGYSSIRMMDELVVVPFEGAVPSSELIANGDYKLSRTLYIYTTEAKFTDKRSVAQVFHAFGSFGAIGPGGLLTSLGLVSTGHAEPTRRLKTNEPRPRDVEEPESAEEHDKPSHMEPASEAH